MSLRPDQQSANKSFCPDCFLWFREREDSGLFRGEVSEPTGSTIEHQAHRIYFNSTHQALTKLFRIGHAAGIENGR
jgi:hypothetical protein